ncbi:Lrp/AsnC family transcriptional regulator [Carnimonas nigrificans]|uniref:Lrp/AsnC family transcriptional regulator n=1 Tax=Carnimonas nigrificans TaxID=64323 RepID=UPI00046E5C8C|nr:Lrp/AsnC family transcriptional regulator [Carnimonas nigrificans]
MKEKDNIRLKSGHAVELDVIDLKILSRLAEDGSVSYARLGEMVSLSAPATHERVKRLKRDGVIRATVALIDGCKLGRTLLTFVMVDTSTLNATRELLHVSQRADVEEFHTIAGDSSVIIKLRAQDTESLEAFLMEIQQVDGVRAVRSYIVLSTFMEHGPLPSVPSV